MDEIKRLRDRRQAYWELAREACEKFEYDKYDTYIRAMELIDEQIRRRDESGTTIDVTALGGREPTYIATFNPGSRYPFQPLITRENTPKQKELAAYNEIFGRSMSPTPSYVSWRKEFEATGAEFAKDRMLEAYKYGDEEGWEERIRPAKSQPAVPRNPEVVLPVLGIVLIVLMFLPVLLF